MDTDANTPVILTDAALEQAKTMLGLAENAGKPLRVYIDGKGCDGFYYGVSFDERLPTDQSWTQDGVEMVIDEESNRYMRGSRVEWVDDERGRGFLVENPGHRKFRGKFYKRPSWIETLTESRGSPPSS